MDGMSEGVEEAAHGFGDGFGLAVGDDLDMSEAGDALDGDEDIFGHRLELAEILEVDMDIAEGDWREGLRVLLALRPWRDGPVQAKSAQAALHLLASQVHISGGGKFLRSSGAISNLTLSINARAGSFAGSFKHPASGRTTKYSGVVLQPNNQGSGFFLGTNRGGFLLLNPAD